jgi:glycosyltransferase involved in cell wall biosynthesis
VLKLIRQNIRNYKKKLRQLVELPFFRKPPRQASLVILDDCFPDLKTAFRVAEFNYLTDLFENVVILSTATKKVFHRYGVFSPLLSQYAMVFPRRSVSVFKFNSYRRISASVAYILFLRNAFEFLNYLEKNRIPFLFTLYPGGGFLLDNEDSDTRLKRIFSSKQFSGVIVTQQITYDYLVKKQLCRPDLIHFTFGVVVDSSSTQRLPVQVVKDQSIEICFVAFKYMKQGLDKGYDVFIETCKILIDRLPNVRFHVVGNFGREDWDISGLEGTLTFHGPMVGSELREFFSGMHLIIAPNRAFTLFVGAFDGFPTGCCVEAALSGVAVFCSDPLGLNSCLEDGRALVQIDVDPARIADTVAHYCADPERLAALRRVGQARFAELYDIEIQMKERVLAIDNLLESNHI